MPLSMLYIRSQLHNLIRLYHCIILTLAASGPLIFSLRVWKDFVIYFPLAIFTRFFFLIQYLSTHTFLTQDN